MTQKKASPDMKEESNKEKLSFSKQKEAEKAKILADLSQEDV